MARGGSQLTRPVPASLVLLPVAPPQDNFAEVDDAGEEADELKYVPPNFSFLPSKPSYAAPKCQFGRPPSPSRNPRRGFSEEGVPRLAERQTC